MMDISRPQASAQRLKGTVRRAITRDDERASLPYEHAVTLAAGLGLLAAALLTSRRPAPVVQALVAGALLYRAASGRDGVRRWAGARGARPAFDARPTASFLDDMAAAARRAGA
jgi:hypothetical protein